MAAPSFRRLMSLGDRDGNTNVHHLAADGKLYLILDNIKTGVKLDLKNNKGETPLCQALLAGHFEVACFLLRHGADASCRANEAESPLAAAIDKTANPFLAKALLAAGYRLSASNDEEKAILEMRHEDSVTDTSVNVSNVIWRKVKRKISLRDMCRHVIRRHLFRRVSKGRSIEAPVRALPLPSILLEFLLFEVNDDFRINFDQMMDNYVRRKAFGWEKMLIEVERPTKSKQPNRIPSTGTNDPSSQEKNQDEESAFTPAIDLLVEEILDRPTDQISASLRRRKFIGACDKPCAMVEKCFKKEYEERRLRNSSLQRKKPPPW